MVEIQEPKKPVVETYDSPKILKIPKKKVKGKNKTKMRVTSLEAFADLLPRLQDREMSVLKIIKKLGPCSDKMIAEALGWKINQVTGRRNALASYSILIQYKKDIDKIPPFKRVIYWKIPEWINGVMIN